MAADTKERILFAALELFSTRGYAAVGMKAIAESAGVNEVTLFRSFGSKEKLWLEVFRRFVVRPEKEFQLKVTTGVARMDLAEVARSVATLLKTNMKLVRMSILDLGQFPEVDDELLSQAPRMMAIIAAHLVSVQPQLKAPAEVVARTLVDTLFGVAMHFEASGKRISTVRTLDGWVEEFLPLFLDGAVKNADQPGKE